MYIGYPNTSIYPTTDIYPMPSIFDRLVYDRTQADVEYVQTLHDKVATGTATTEELEEWNEDSLKGAYNYTDLNRIGFALTIIKSQSDVIGRSCVYPYSIVTNYSRTSLPTNTTITQLLANIQVVKVAYADLITVTLPTSIRNISNANTIEKFLHDVGQIESSTVAAYRYGDSNIYSGDNS